jgi:hypothetical protein
MQSDDLSSAIMNEIAELVGVLERLEECALGQNDLKVAGLADAESDMDQPVSQFEMGRGFNVENGIQVTCRHCTTTPTANAEQCNIGLTHVNKVLPPKFRIDAISQPIPLEP